MRVGVGDDRLPRLAVPEQHSEGVGDERRGGLVAGEQQAVAERGDLVIGDLGAGALRLDEVGDQAVAAVVVRLDHEPLAFLPVLDQVVRVRDLLLVVEVAPRHRAARVGPALVGRHHRGVDAEEGEDRDRRDVVGDVAEEVALAIGVVEHALESSAGVLADRRLEGLEAARGERALGDRPDAGVVGRDAGRQAGVGGEAALLHDAGCLGASLPDREPARSRSRRSPSRRTPRGRRPSA